MARLMHVHHAQVDSVRASQDDANTWIVLHDCKHLQRIRFDAMRAYGLGRRRRGRITHLIGLFHNSLSSFPVSLLSPVILWDFLSTVFPRTLQRHQHFGISQLCVVSIVTHRRTKGKARRVTMWQGNACNPKFGRRVRSQSGERMRQKTLANSAVCCWLPYRAQLTESQVIHSEEILPSNKVSKITRLLALRAHKEGWVSF